VVTHGRSNNPIAAPFLVRRGPSGCPLFASWPWPRDTGGSLAERPARLRIVWGVSPHAVHGPMRTASIAKGGGGNTPSEARTEKPRLPRGSRDPVREERPGGRAHPEACTAAQDCSPALLPVRQSLDGYGGVPSRCQRGAGRCPLGSNGWGHPGHRRGMGPRLGGKRRGENAGKGYGPAGTCDHLHRPPDGGTTEGGGRGVVGRMSP